MATCFNCFKPLSECTCTSRQSPADSSKAVEYQLWFNVVLSYLQDTLQSLDVMDNFKEYDFVKDFESGISPEQSATKAIGTLSDS